MEIIILALAVFGFTWLIRNTDGPFAIFRYFRMLVGATHMVTYPQYNSVVKEEEYLTGFTAKLFQCYWCLGTWVAAIFVVLYLLYFQWIAVQWFIYWMACVGITGIVFSWAEGRKE